MEKHEFESVKVMMSAIFPVFSDLKNPKPLKIGINKDIFKLIDEHPNAGILSKKKIRMFLYWYTSKKSYQKALLNTDIRYDLDANLSLTQILPDHKKAAKKNIYKLNAKLKKKPFKPKKKLIKEGENK